MRSQAFADESKDVLPKKDDTKPPEHEAEYVFEGLQIDFSEKIALTPPLTVKGQTLTVKGQTVANG